MPSLENSVNAFHLEIESEDTPDETAVYRFDSEELGKAFENTYPPYTVTVESPHNKHELTLLDSTHTELKTRTITYGPTTPRDAADAEKLLNTTLWDWAVYLRSNYHHPARDALEELGIIDHYPPMEKTGTALHKGKWHHSLSPEYVNPTCGDTRGVMTRGEFWKTNPDRKWYAGHVTVRYYHGKQDYSSDPDPETVWGVCVDISHRPIKPVEERDSKLDRMYFERETVANDSRNEETTVSELLDYVQTGMDLLTEEAEIVASEYRQDIESEAKRRWNPETETFEAQTGITNWG